MKIGVAMCRPRSRTQKEPPRGTGVIGMMRATQLPHTAHAVATNSRFFSRPQRMRTAAKIRTNTKILSTESDFSSR
jgi:hypothetical protein